MLIIENCSLSKHVILGLSMVQVCQLIEDEIGG